MKLNKILSSALVVIMLLTSLMTLLPVSALASEDAPVKVTMGEIDPEKNDPDALIYMHTDGCIHEIMPDLVAGEIEPPVHLP